MIFPLSQNEMDGVANLGCDGTDDVNNLPKYAESNRLKPGSTCMCIDNGVAYMMKSDGTWKALG